MKVLIFDDVVFARGETFNLPGLDVHVFEHADDAATLAETFAADIVFMDFAMGSDHADGAAAITALRAVGYTKTIIAISSDPLQNDKMVAAGADDRLAQKAMLRSYLASLGTDDDSS